MTIYQNQRSKARPRILGKIMYTSDKDGDWYDTYMRNCTNEGVSFLSNFPYLPGTKIYIKSVNKMDSSLQPAKVKWSKKKKFGRPKYGEYSIGAKFM